MSSNPRLVQVAIPPMFDLGRGAGGGGGGGFRGGFGGHPIQGRFGGQRRWAPNESGFCGPNAAMGTDGMCHPIQELAGRLDLGRSALGQFTMPREVAFRIIDESGYHVVNAGKKFPFTITNIVAADGTLISSGPVKGTAVSGDDSLLKVSINLPRDPNDFSPQDQPADATLTLSGVFGGVQYPIIESRKIRFTVPPASAFPLDLQAIYAKYGADKYAAETARQDEIMGQQYAAMVAAEAAAQTAAEKARAAEAVQAAADAAQAAADKASAAAADAAAKKKAADDAVQIALNEKTQHEKTLWVLGGVLGLAALGTGYYFWK